MRQAGSDNTLVPPVVRVRADSELALASVLGLGSGRGAAGTHSMRAGVVLGLLLGLALVLALASLGAVL